MILSVPLIAAMVWESACAEGRYSDANARACETLGYTRDELLGMSVADVELSHDPGESSKRWREAISGRPRTFQALHRRKDGSTFPVEVWECLFDDGIRPLLAAVARDVSASRKVEDDLRQTPKMEALGRMAGGVAHDFNNLLTAILGYSDILLGRVGAGSPLRAELSEVKRAGERAAQLTRQLLAFSRRQTVRPKTLDLNTVVADIESMLRRLMPETIRLELAPSAGEPWLRADSGQLDQVLLNLALNARDAMPRGGTLQISTAVSEVDPEFVRRHPGCAPGCYAVLSIADTGLGIPKEALAHLFEPFYTTKGVGKGTGLGLATVYGITKQSGGFLTVSSEVGRGTTFRVYLPRVLDRPSRS